MPVLIAQYSYLDVFLWYSWCLEFYLLRQAASICYQSFFGSHSNYYQTYWCSICFLDFQDRCFLLSIFKCFYYDIGHFSFCFKYSYKPNFDFDCLCYNHMRIWRCWPYYVYSYPVHPHIFAISPALWLLIRSWLLCFWVCFDIGLLWGGELSRQPFPFYMASTLSFVLTTGWVIPDLS